MPLWIFTQRKFNEAMMKHAVDSAWAILCFISQAFEDAPECKMQVMYAIQRGVPLIPVRLQGSGWKPSGWLADSVAGLLWVDLSNDCDQEESKKFHNVTVAVKQVTGLEFSGGLTPRPGDAPIMQPPKRALTPAQKAIYESINAAVRGKHGWVSWKEFKSWSEVQSPPVEVTQIQLAKVDRDLYGNFHTKQVVAIVAAASPSA